MNSTETSADWKWGTVGIVVCQLRDDDIDRLPKLIGAASNFFYLHNVVLVGSLSSIQIGLFGFPNLSMDRDEVDSMRAFCENLQTELRDDCRLVFGQVNAPIGNFGGSYVQSYGVLIQGIEHWLRAVFGLKYGEAKLYTDTRPDLQLG